MADLKTASLRKAEQNANFSHLMGIIQGASTYKQLKSVWFELKKIEKEVKADLGANCWIMSFRDNQELTVTYNTLKATKFAYDVEQEMKQTDEQVNRIEAAIYKVKTLDELKVINLEIYSKVHKKDAKAYLKEIAAKAYKELMSA